MLRFSILWLAISVGPAQAGTRPEENCGEEVQRRFLPCPGDSEDRIVQLGVRRIYWAENQSVETIMFGCRAPEDPIRRPKPGPTLALAPGLGLAMVECGRPAEQLMVACAKSASPTGPAMLLYCQSAGIGSPPAYPTPMQVSGGPADPFVAVPGAEEAPPVPADE